MSDFEKVRVWFWTRYFQGTLSIQTSLETTDKQVREHIQKNISLGGGGNWDSSSLTSKVMKLKKSKVQLTQL